MNNGGELCDTRVDTMSILGQVIAASGVDFPEEVDDEEELNI